MEKKWFNKEAQEVEKEFGTSISNGLSQKQVEENKAKYGLNELQEKKKDSIFKKFLAQFKDFSIIVLIIAAIVSGIVGVAEGEGLTDTIIILIVVILNAVIGVVQESKDGIKEITYKIKYQNEVELERTVWGEKLDT